jgi:hypothetical protein
MLTICLVALDICLLLRNHSLIAAVKFQIQPFGAMTSVKVPSILNNAASFAIVEDNDTSISTEDAMNIESVVHKPPAVYYQRSYTSVMQGLTLNLNEPWERSLSRLLEDVSNTNEPNRQMMNSYRGNTILAPTITSPTSTVQQTSVPELMLLSRTESRDYALEIEGDSCSGTIMNLSMDDSTNSSSIVSNGTKNTSPLRSRHHPIGSIYRKTLSKKQLNTTGHKSLFDDSDNDDESNDTATSGKCRLEHKFSSDSLFLFYEQQQQRENLEDRGEQEDDSDRKMADENHPSERSFSIRKASAICDEYDHDGYYNNSYYEYRQLLIPDRRPSRPSINQYPPSNLYLPTF